MYNFYLFINKYLYKKEGRYKPIIYKNVVIVPNAWKINYKISKKKESFQKFETFFNTYVKTYGVEQYILAGMGDQKLLLNINDKMHREILYDLLKKDNELLLFENIFKKENLIIYNQNNKKYVGEFIFSLKGNEYTNRKILFPYVTHQELFENSSNVFNEWISLKIYIDSDFENQIISQYISYLYEEIYLNDIGSDLFFIRYKDNRNHLRIRIKSSDTNKPVIFSILKEMVENLEKVKILNDCIIDTYVREYERYGGKDIIEYVENFFTYDSYFCTQIIKMKNSIFTTLSFKELYIISIIRMLNDFEISLKEKLIILKSYKDVEIDKKEYEAMLENIKESILNDSIDEYLNRTAEGIQLYLLLDDVSKIHKKYYNVLLKKYKVVESQRVIESILSIMHMRYNRMVGIDREEENKVMKYIEKILYSKYTKELHYESK